MAKARHKRRVLMWASLVGFTATLVAAVVSEFVTVSYRERTGSVPSRFVLHRSSVTVVYRVGGDDIDWLGRDLFRQGWSIVPGPVHPVWGRVWAPSCSRDVNAAFTLWHARMPLWAPAVLFAAGAWVGRRGGWKGEGFCARCGYDLCGLSGSACPECGDPSAACTRKAG